MKFVNRQSALLCFVLSLPTTFPGNGFAVEAEETSLKETLEFIALKIKSCQPQITFEDGYANMEHWTFSYDDTGKIVLDEKYDTTNPRSMRMRNTYAVLLSELDPVVLIGRPGMVELKLQCSKHACVEHQGTWLMPDGRPVSPEKRPPDIPSTSLELRFFDDDTRNRLVKAFTHAILKSGGKRSPF